MTYPPLTSVVVASANPHKVEEMESVLRSVLPDVTLIARPSHVPDVVEDADTLVGNARLKARALVEATGLPAVADDTGLFVEALDGDPGVFTARYAGEHATYAENCDKLLAELMRVGATSPDQRSAKFVTAIVLQWPSGEELVVEGFVTGVIADDLRGDAGFGYDPLFAPIEEDGRTFAELGAARKNELSHRARALHLLAERLRPTAG